jgi:hypothetical protein
MSLVAGRGPLSKDPAGWFSPPLPDNVVFVEPHPRRVQALLDDRTVIDTEHALLVHRREHPLRYAFLADEVGELPGEAVPEAPGYVHVPWHAVDAWLEEGRRLVHYPPNPYHRVDCRPTNRGLRVTVAAPRWSTPSTLSSSSKLLSNLGFMLIRRSCVPTCCDEPTPPATAITRAMRRTGRLSLETPSSKTSPGATKTRPPRPCP